MSMKNSYETVGNRTLDLPACSPVRQLRHRVPPPKSIYYIALHNGEQILGATSPWLPNFEWRRQIFLSPQYGIFFMSPFRRLELWGGSEIFDFIYQRVDLVSTVMKLRLYERQTISWSAEIILNSQDVFSSMGILHVHTYMQVDR